jgi:hypothetical protein
MTLGILGLGLFLAALLFLYLGRNMLGALMALLLGVVIATSGGPLGQMATAMVQGIRTGGNAAAAMFDGGKK